MLAANVIIKLYECNNKFHVVMQGYTGQITHKIFNSKFAAKAYLLTLDKVEVKCEKV